MLGERGRGFANVLRVLDEGRVAIAALAVGAAQGCVTASMRCAQRCESFGRPISTNQGMSFKIARMEARAYTARPAYYRAAALMIAAREFKK